MQVNKTFSNNFTSPSHRTICARIYLYRRITYKKSVPVNTTANRPANLQVKLLKSKKKSTK